MKITAFAIVSLTVSVFVGCATRPVALSFSQPTVVEAACGECKFGMKGDDCDLAIRVGGQSYFVDGVSSDSLGNAHAADGICETIRQARVTGSIRHGRFAVTSFELLPTPLP